jgi:hypothetical protein
LEEDRSEIEEFLVRAIATKVEAADDSADGASEDDGAVQKEPEDRPNHQPGENT